MSDERILHLSDSNFDEAAREGVTLVDFWAPWCGPCRMMGPILDDLAAQFDGSVRIAKVNVDDSAELAVRFGIQAIPLLVILKDGRELGRMVGVQSKHAVAAALDRALKAAGSVPAR